MNTNALSVANYFIELATNDGSSIRPLKLMKLVYIAYGYALAILGKSIIDSRFDKVEAWKFGPVIPSVYHSFKQYGKHEITQKTTIFVEIDGEITVKTPELMDEDVRKVCSLTWRRYKNKTDNQLVTLLHGVGTPWANVYVEGQNNPIPEEFTRLYYKELIEYLTGEKL